MTGGRVIIINLKNKQVINAAQYSQYFRAVVWGDLLVLEYYRVEFELGSGEN